MDRSDAQSAADPGWAWVSAAGLLLLRVAGGLGVCQAAEALSWSCGPLRHESLFGAVPAALGLCLGWLLILGGTVLDRRRPLLVVLAGVLPVATSVGCFLAVGWVARAFGWRG